MVQIEALEASIRNHKETHTKNTKGFRDRLGQLNSEKSTLNATISDLSSKLKAVTAERDSLKAAPAQSNDSTQELAQQLEVLRREKAAVDKLLDEETAKPKGAPDQSSEHAALIVCIFASHKFLR